MNMSDLINNLTPEVYTNLREAVEIGKWSDGTPLTRAQKAHSLQLVMAYQSKVLKSTEHFSVGEDGHIVMQSKQALQQQFSSSNTSSEKAPSTQETAGIARFTHDDI